MNDKILKQVRTKGYFIPKNHICSGEIANTSGWIREYFIIEGKNEMKSQMQCMIKNNIEKLKNAILDYANSMGGEINDSEELTSVCKLIDKIFEVDKYG